MPAELIDDRRILAAEQRREYGERPILGGGRTMAGPDGLIRAVLRGIKR